MKREEKRLKKAKELQEQLLDKTFKENIPGGNSYMMQPYEATMMKGRMTLVQDTIFENIQLAFQAEYRKQVENNMKKNKEQLSLWEKPMEPIRVNFKDLGVRPDCYDEVHNAALIMMSSNALKHSSVPRYRSRAHYELAELAVKHKDFAAARREYLAAAAVRDAGQYALAGRFGAALAAFKLGDFANCGKEAFQLAGEHPELPQAPQVLYLGYRAARLLKDSELKNQCANLHLLHR